MWLQRLWDIETNKKKSLRPQNVVINNDADQMKTYCLQNILCLLGWMFICDVTVTLNWSSDKLSGNNTHFYFPCLLPCLLTAGVNESNDTLCGEVSDHLTQDQEQRVSRARQDQDRPRPSQDQDQD